MQNKSFKRGWQLVLSSWQVLRLDKELVVLPVIGYVVALLAIAGIVALPFAFFTIASSTGTGGLTNYSYTAPIWLNVIIGITVYFVVTLVSNFFSGAIIYGATQRFNGHNPTITSSLTGAKRRFLPLAGFSLLMSTVGLALQTLEERLPFAGALAVWLLNAAWSIANIFAVPIIVLSDHNVHPLDATKESVKIIKKVWGEGVTANVGIGLIGLLSMVSFMMVLFLLTALGAAAHVPAFLGVIGFGLAVVLLFSLLLILIALSSITKAAVYHYAVTGRAPQMFNTELLHATISPKRARRIFR